MDVYFYLSSDVQYNVQVKVHCITGLDPVNILQQDANHHYSPTTSSEAYECYIEAQLYQKGMRLGLPVCCGYKQFCSSHCEWNEWLVFPVRFCDISREAQITFTVYAVSPSPLIIGGVTLPLFEQRILRYGRHKLRLLNGVCGDGSMDSKTLFCRLNRQLTVCDQLEAVLTMKLMRKIPQVTWLDALTNRRLLKISSSSSIHDASCGIYLYVDLPNLGHHVVYQEKAKSKKFTSSLHHHIESQLLTLYDPEMKLNNPVLEKNKKLTKHSAMATYDQRPTSFESQKLSEIIRSWNLTDFDCDLLWKFRNFLVDDSNALTKFLRTVDQTSDYEVAIALDLIEKWVEIDVADALELLSAHFVHPLFRSHGILVLRKRASDRDLELYIMQLVQAIRFENDLGCTLSELPRFLLDRSLESSSFRLLNFLYWSVVVAAKAEEESARYSFFLTRIETECLKNKHKYYDEIETQKVLIQELIALSEYIGSIKGRAEDKKKALKAALKKNGRFQHLQEFEKAPIIPLRPEIRVCGIEPTKCTVFKSALCPFLLAFKIKKELTHLEEEDEEEEEDDKEDRRKQLIDLENDEYYKIIWKNGDDLRQDQLIIQMINLMDNLLREVNLDLCLTPYPVLATGVDHGMLEYVPDSTAIAGILKQFDDNISSFLTYNNNKPSQLKASVDTFVRSCAGYCVITFLLGVGDRHLDNLLITKSGHLFHIDFGFIYGDDPKPWPPPMKICKQMIEAMGSYNSPHYKQFQQHMISSYNELRKKAPLILNLLSLMGQGDIQEIQENVNFVHSKFRLDLNAEQASAYLLNLMEESVNALFTKVVDKIHDWATYWR